jgi:hypothetical protein
MSFATRLARVGRLAGILSARPPRCPSCRSPLPSVPTTVVLAQDGLMFNTSPCRTYGGAGGGEYGIPFDPELGPIGNRQPVICLAGGPLKEWLVRHADRTFGTHLDPYYAWLPKKHLE